MAAMICQPGQITFKNWTFRALFWLFIPFCKIHYAKPIRFFILLQIKHLILSLEKWLASQQMKVIDKQFQKSVRCNSYICTLFKFPQDLKNSSFMFYLNASYSQGQAHLELNPIGYQFRHVASAEVKTTMLAAGILGTRHKLVFITAL